MKKLFNFLLFFFKRRKLKAAIKRAVYPLTYQLTLSLDCKQVVVELGAKHMMIQGAVNAEIKRAVKNIKFSVEPLAPDANIKFICLSKTFLFLLLLFALPSQAQDTTCISTERLGRIADTLHHYKQHKQAFEACEAVQQLQVQKLKMYEETAVLKDSQLVNISQAYTEAEAARSTWKETATECTLLQEKTFKQLQKANRQRKAWRGAAFGFLGALGAGITATILILK